MNFVNSNQIDLKALGRQFKEEGYCIGPVVIPKQMTEDAARGMDEVMAKRYETGVEPLDSWWNPGDDPNKKLRKIDQPHVANNAIRAFITHPNLGRTIAQITGASMIQVWCVQLLHKPGRADLQGAVGWHQDYQYWTKWWTPDSEVFTAWVAVSDVDAESGPMCFVPGSNQWGFLEQGDFFGAADDRQRQTINIPKGHIWKETPAIMSAGAFSLHHRLTLHGSHPNTSSLPRRSFAIHLRTENSNATPSRGVNPTDKANYDYVSFLNNHEICPVIYQKE